MCLSTVSCNVKYMHTHARTTSGLYICQTRLSSVFIQCECANLPLSHTLVSKCCLYCVLLVQIQHSAYSDEWWRVGTVPPHAVATYVRGLPLLHNGIYSIIYNSKFLKSPTLGWPAQKGFFSVSEVLMRTWVQFTIDATTL